MDTLYSVVIPVYNAESSLDELYVRLASVLEPLSGGAFELIFVDDASRDAGFLKLKALHQQDGRVKVIRLQRNYGQQNATLCGFHYARGRTVITLDDDLQHPPEEIPKLIAKLDEGFQAVFGIPDIKRHAGYRRLGTQCVNLLLSWVCAKPFTLRVSSFRAVRREIAAEIAKKESGPVYFSAEILAFRPRAAQVTVDHAPRVYGRSGYTLRKLAGLFVMLLLNYSFIAKIRPRMTQRPLEIAETLL